MGGYFSRFMVVSGYILLLVTAGLVSFLVQYYTCEFLLLLGGLIIGHFALRLIFGVNPSFTEVIRKNDRSLLEPLIRDANKEAINQYVILSSLTGFTGTFQKIGFSGLLLVTVTLTLVFSFLSFFQ